MNTQATAPKIKKETKNKIRVEFERTSLWTRIKLKYFSVNFLKTVIFKLLRFALLIGISYVILSPVISKVFSSFFSREDFVDVTVKYISKSPTIATYKALIREAEYFKVVFNTACLSVFCALVQTFICCVVGYGFAKFKFKFNSLLFFLVVFTMVVPHETLKLAMYLKFAHFDFLGIVQAITGHDINLLNTYWPLALLSLGGLAFKNGLYIFMMRQFFRGVPDELEESAYIDGSGVFRTFIRIIIPLSVPMMITIFLFSFSWQWTDMFYTRLFFVGNKVQLMPSLNMIPKTLDTVYAGQSMYESAIRNTASLLIIAPLIVLYLFCQRYLIAGIERSGIVG